MLEQSKFAGALDRLNKKPPMPTKPEQHTADELPTTLHTSPAPSGKRRLTGKRSDPEYSPTTFFVRKETKRKVAQLLLEDANSKTDLSDLVERLLAEWVSEQSR